MKNECSEFYKMYKEIINESITWSFFIQDTILFIFNRENNDTDMIGIPHLKSMSISAKDNFSKIIDALKDQRFNVEVISDDNYEDGIYFQINGKEITVGIMIALDKLNNDDINALKDYLLGEGFSQGI